MIPESPSRTTVGKRMRERVTARSRSPPGVPKSSITQGASSMKSAVMPLRPSRISQKSVEATRQARFASPFSSSSLKTGTKTDETAESARRLRTVFGTWNATVNALIFPPAPKK